MSFLPLGLSKSKQNKGGWLPGVMGIAVFIVKHRSLLMKAEHLFTLCLVTFTVTSDGGYHLFGSHELQTGRQL